jgi:2-iminobutanoate/2-iminopropanoate deaminase
MKELIKASKAPEAVGPYSNAIKAGNFIFVTGQLPVNPDTGLMPRTIQEQTRQVIENIKNILADAGASLSDVVKATVFISEMSLFSEMNAVYAEEFTKPYPARTSTAIKELPKSALVSIDVVAIID